MRTLADLVRVHARPGAVTWLGVSPTRRAPIESADAVEVRAGTGIVGDRHARSGRSRRQVTLVQAEHLAAIGSLVGRPVHPEDLRRNVVVEGISVYALRAVRFRIGAVLLEGTGPCEPCSRMEENLGPGGYNACRGHGGITAIVIEPGVIHVGDPVFPEPR